ncbi:MAG TPA: DUF2163 domain-containing protein, partial [Sphingomicrobium sp.]
LTSLALCWTIERADGAGLALTSHDQAVVRDGVVHVPSPGIVPASVSRGLGLDPPSGEVAGSLSSEALAEQDLALGRWDGARVRLAALDWATPEPTADLIAGEIGAVSTKGESFSADLSGAAAALDEAVCPSTSPHCRAQFGDKQCRIDLGGRSASAFVASCENGEITLDRAFDERFLLGRLRYMSGENCGITTVIIAVDGATVRVRDIPRGTVESGCRVELREGCDKRFETCVERFDNAVNFRGEPHLPGADLLTRYPGAQG